MDVVVGDVEGSEALEDGAGAHVVEVDPGDRELDLHLGLGEDQRQPSLERFCLA